MLHRNKHRIRQNEKTRSLLQTKEDKIPGKKKTLMKQSNSSDKNFKPMIIKMLTELGRRMEVQRGNILKNQS